LVHLSANGPSGILELISAMMISE
jgi:hypothetical protein